MKVGVITRLHLFRKRVQESCAVPTGLRFFLLVSQGLRPASLCRPCGNGAGAGGTANGRGNPNVSKGAKRRATGQLFSNLTPPGRGPRRVSHCFQRTTGGKAAPPLPRIECCASGRACFRQGPCLVASVRRPLRPMRSILSRDAVKLTGAIFRSYRVLSPVSRVHLAETE